MRNIKLIISYDGTHLHGWQRQLVGSTVQGELEKALSIMCGDPVNILGAGRTDAGVHAEAMTANFRTVSSIPPEGFKNGLNSLLGDNIRIMDASQVALNFHSRRDAVAKIYEYHFCLKRVASPLDRLYRTYFKTNRPFDMEAVKRALKYLLGEHDFSSFEASGSRKHGQPGRGAVRKIFSARIFPLEEKEKTYYFRLVGDGFLRHMVRNIAGTLLEIGLGRRQSEDMEKIISARNRESAGPTAPARGLVLREVFYSPCPYDDE